MTTTHLIRRLVLTGAIAVAVVGSGAAGGTGLAATPATSSAATSLWGAIAVSPATGHTGVSWNYPSATAAGTRARRECAAADCQVVVEVSNGCAALAQADNRALGWAARATLAAAETAAKRATRGAHPRIVAWVCS